MRWLVSTSAQSPVWQDTSGLQQVLEPLMQKILDRTDGAGSVTLCVRNKAIAG